MTTFAITGASGQLGRLVTEKLLATVDPADVVLLSRNPDSLAEFADRGATVRRADFDDPATLGAAFAGVDRVLLISTDVVGQRLDGHRAAIDAAKAAGVDRIAYTSIVRPEAGNPAGVVPDHIATEQYLRDSGVHWVMLRNALYADMQVDTLTQAAATKEFVTNAGAGRTSYVTRADCAAVAVAALVGDTADVEYDVTGPDALSAADLAELAELVAGAPVGVVAVDDASYTAGLVKAGLPDPIAALLASFGTSTREGYADVVSTVVRDLTGQEPTRLRALVA